MTVSAVKVPSQCPSTLWDMIPATLFFMETLRAFCDLLSAVPEELSLILSAVTASQTKETLATCQGLLFYSVRSQLHDEIYQWNCVNLAPLLKLKVYQLLTGTMCIVCGISTVHVPRSHDQCSITALTVFF